MIENCVYTERQVMNFDMICSHMLKVLDNMVFFILEENMAVTGFHKHNIDYIRCHVHIIFTINMRIHQLSLD